MNKSVKEKVKNKVEKILSELYNERTDNFNMDLVSVKVQNLKKLERQKTRNLNQLVINEVPGPELTRR